MNKSRKFIHLESRLWMTILVFLGSVSAAFAQISVKGVVTDDTGEGMPGVSVVVKGTTTGTTSDLNGNFTISVPNDKAVLNFSFLGYIPQQQKVKKGTVMKVIMQEDKKLLDEVVVVGYQEVRKRDLTGSVSKANMNALLNTPVSSFDQTLGGRIAGVNVSSGEGMPGGTMNIVIRGNNSLTQDNSPLYVIDGFPMEDPRAGEMINPADIASIDILKDASATAIYGARGANGVVIITTKSAKIGAPKIRYDFSIGTQTASKKIKMMDAYDFVQLQNEMYPGVIKDTYLTDYEGKQWTVDDYRNIPQYDWQDEIFRTGITQSHNINISSGSQNLRVNTSASYFDQDGVLLNSNYKRYQARTNATYQKKKLKIYGTMQYSRAIQSGNSPSQSSYSGMNNLFYSVWGYRPVTQPGVPLQSLKEKLIDEDIVTTNDYRFNPIMSLNNEYNKRYTTFMQLNGYVEYEIVKGLKAKISGGFTHDMRSYQQFNNSKTRYGGITSTDKVNASITNTERQTWLNENTLTYQTNIKKQHFFNSMVGLSFQNSNSNYYFLKTVHIPNESRGLAGMSEGTAAAMGSDLTSWSMISAFGRFNYNYKSKYYATFTFRADGSSKFRDKNRFGYFPSASLAWQFTEEKFMRPLKKVLNSGKMRLSWGLTGNNRVGEYDTFGAYKLDKYLGSYGFNGTQETGTIPVSLSNKDLKWETTEQWDLGFDLGFLNDRITTTVDLYSKTTHDLLLAASLPLTSGFDTAMKNIGKVRNQGIEFTVNTLNIKHKHFNWSSNFNIAFNQNKVLALSDNQNSLLSTVRFDQKYNSQPSYIAKIGYSMGMMYGYLYDGTYKYDDFNESNGTYTLKGNVPHFASENNTQPGMPKYRDLNGDGIINDNDKTFIGRGMPINTGGFTNDFKIYDFDLSIFFQWSYGNQIMNANRLFFESSNNKARDLNQFATYADRWTANNPTSDIPRATTSASNNVISSRIIEDGSFLRLKTVTLGYTLPKKVLRRTFVDNLRLYLAAQNIFTLTKYSGYDPEVSIRESALTPGLDFSSYPRAFSFDFGLNLTF